MVEIDFAFFICKNCEQIVIIIFLIRKDFQANNSDDYKQQASR